MRANCISALNNLIKCTFIIFGSVAYLGSFSLKSAVSTTGSETRMVSVPMSVSLSTTQLYQSIQNVVGVKLVTYCRVFLIRDVSISIIHFRLLQCNYFRHYLRRSAVRIGPQSSCESALRPTKKGSTHRSSLAVVPVDGLLTENNSINFFSFC